MTKFASSSLKVLFNSSQKGSDLNALVVSTVLALTPYIYIIERVLESHIKMNSCYMLAWTLDNNDYTYLAFRLRIQGILLSAGINCYSMHYEA